MSSRLHKLLAEWAEDDVLALVRDKVPEGQRLDYKRELNLGSKAERLEAAKDASGMANAVGGLLIYGVDEQELADGSRIPVKAAPLPAGDAQDRLEDVPWSTVAPRLNLAGVTIEASGGGYFVVMRIQQRAGPPHMVDGYDQHRYFARRPLDKAFGGARGRGCVPASPRRQSQS